jgi:hypothetical protein
MKIRAMFKHFVLMSSFITILLSCNKDKDHSPTIEKDITVTGFTKVFAIHGFNVIITKGNSFSIKAKGPSTYVNDIKLSVTNNMLDLQFEHNWSNRPIIDVIITLPNLIQVTLGDAGKAVVNGFENENHVMRAVLSGASKCTFNGAPINVSFDLTGASQFDVNGATLNLYGSMSGGSRLNAYGLVADEVDIEANSGSEAHVKVVNVFFASATGGSRIYYKGDPAVKNTESSGGGQVIKE